MTDYILNKFCPLLVVGLLCFINFGFLKFEPYIIIAMLVYSSHFNYKVGYSMGICKKHGLL